MVARKRVLTVSKKKEEEKKRMVSNNTPIKFSKEDIIEIIVGNEGGKKEEKAVSYKSIFINEIKKDLLRLDYWELDLMLMDIIKFFPKSEIMVKTVRGVGTLSKLMSKVISPLSTSALKVDELYQEKSKPDSVVPISIKEYLIEGPLWHPKHLEILQYVSKSPKYFKLLLYGPPGTGKSSISSKVEEIAHRHSDNYVDKFTISEFDKDTMKALKQIHPSKTLLVIDDVDLLLSKKREGDSESRRATKHLLDLLDRFNMVIMTTNNVKDLDPAVLRARRITKKVEIGNIQIDDVKVLIENHLVSVVSGNCSILRKFPSLSAGGDIFSRIAYCVNKSEGLEYVTELVLEKTKKGGDGLYNPSTVSQNFLDTMIDIRTFVAKNAGGESVSRDSLILWEEEEEGRLPWAKALSKNTKKVKTVFKLLNSVSNSYIMHCVGGGGKEGKEEDH